MKFRKNILHDMIKINFGSEGPSDYINKKYFKIEIVMRLGKNSSEV